MSDGALSQAEIDALLGGGGGGAPAPSPSAASGDTNAIKDCLSGTIDAQSSNLSTMTGATVHFSGPSVSGSNRDAFLADLPDMITTIKVDFTSGFPGEHVFIMGEDTAKGIASLMNKEENITLDDMAMSVIGEVASQMVGTEITALTNKTGNKSIASGSPEAANIAKAAAALPAGDFTVAAYGLDLGDGIAHKMWEVFGHSVTSAIAQAIRGAAAPQASTGGGGAAMGGVGMGGVFSQTPGVQAVQFPSLAGTMSAREQGNIGLLMDVFMEMTVELGRTRKLIKEILSMGEGTIIELDKLAGEPVDILVNHVPIAKGEVVVIDENFGVRVTEIVSPAERMGDIG
jgi:flagellar motor switch protein FliN/FliY